MEIRPLSLCPISQVTATITTVTSGVRVRATCRCGNVIDTVAPTGKVTWRGPCPRCNRSILARRVKAGELAPVTPAGEPVETEPTTGPVRKVAAYAPDEIPAPGFIEPRPGPGGPDAGLQTDPSPEGGPPAAPVDEPGDDVEDDDERVDEPAPVEPVKPPATRAILGPPHRGQLFPGLAI